MSEASSAPSPTLVPFQRPSLPTDSAIATYLALSRERHWYSNGGPCERMLAERVSAFIGRGTRCMPVASGTAGLMVASRALAGRPSDERYEALMPSFTFIATAAAAQWAGFEPVFVDVEPEGWHLDPAALVRALEESRRAPAIVLACSSFGVPPPAETARAWELICAEHSVPLLIDSAAGFGAADDAGDPLGARGDAEVFSFHATKPLAAGEGGVISTRSAQTLAEVERLCNFGLDHERKPGAPVGINAKLSEPAAAVALAALDTLDQALTARRKRAAVIGAALTDQGFALQVALGSPAWQFVPARAPNPQIREAALEIAAANAVELRTYYQPLHSSDAFPDARTSGLPVTDELAGTILSLPMSTDLSGKEIERIVEVCALAAESSALPARSSRTDLH